MVQTTEQAGVVPHLGRVEAERLRHYYLGPEHLLLGLLRQGDDPVPHGDNAAARLLRHHGLDLAAARAGVDRLIADGGTRAEPRRARGTAASRGSCDSRRRR